MKSLSQRRSKVPGYVFQFKPCSSPAWPTTFFANSSGSNIQSTDMLYGNQTRGRFMALWKWETLVTYVKANSTASSTLCFPQTMHPISNLACRSITSLSFLTCRTISTLVRLARITTAHRVSRWQMPFSTASHRSSRSNLFIFLLLTLTQARRPFGNCIYVRKETTRRSTIPSGRS